MTLVRWNNQSLKPTVNSFMDDFFDNSNFFQNFEKMESFPATNIEETEHAFNLKMAVPGLSREDIKVEVDNNILFVSAEKEREELDENKNYTRREYNYSTFKRSFVLPENTDLEKIDAICKDGQLNIVLPKLEIEIRKTKEIVIS